MPVETLIHLLIKISIMVGLGFLLRKIHIITEELQQGLSNLLLKAVLPINIIASAQVEFSAEIGKKLGEIAIVALGYYVAAIILSTLISKKLALSDSGKNVFITMSVFANTGFMGFPIMSELYGDTGLLLAVVYNMFYQLFFFTYGISILSGKGKMDIRSVVTNPVTIASFLAVIIFLTGFRLPIAVQDTFSSIGGMMVPLSMMIIGCSLADMDLKTILKDGYSFLVSLLRLLVYPILVLMVLKWLKLPSLVIAVGTLMTALPSGSLNVILATQYDCEPEYAARTVVQSMLLSIIAIPLMIVLIQLLQ